MDGTRRRRKATAVSTIGFAAVLAGVSFALAMSLLITFFVTNDQRADRWAERVFLVFFVLAALVVYEIHLRYVAQSPLVWVATIAALGALGGLFVAETLVTTGRIQFDRVAAFQTGGFAVFVLWILAASALILTFGGLPASVGWLGVVAVAIALAVIGWLVRDPKLVRGERAPTTAENALTTLPFIGVVAWLVWLGLSL